MCRPTVRIRRFSFPTLLAEEVFRIDSEVGDEAGADPEICERGRSLLFPSSPLPLFLSSLRLPFSPSLPLEVGPLKQLGSPGSAGGENEFDAL